MSSQGLGIKAVYNILANASGVTSIATGGVYSYNINQGAAPPYILITEEEVTPEDTKSDIAGTGAKTHRHYLTISAYSKKRSTTESLSAAIDTALNHYSGTANSVVVGDIRYQGSGGGYAESIYYKNMDYEVWTKQ